MQGRVGNQGRSPGVLGEKRGGRAGAPVFGGRAHAGAGALMAMVWVHGTEHSGTKVGKGAVRTTRARRWGLLSEAGVGMEEGNLGGGEWQTLAAVGGEMLREANTDSL